MFRSVGQRIISSKFGKLPDRKRISISVALSSVPNSSIVPTAVENRNPRNLEKLRIGEKPMGWVHDNPGKNYWHKIVLDVSGKHTSGKVVHYSGAVAVRASTQEWCIEKELYSSSDVAAAETIGIILAKRCLQIGLTEVESFFTEEELKKEKVSLFVKAMEEGGVKLKEPDQIDEMQRVLLHHRKREVKAWEVIEEMDENVLSKLIKKSE